jgi:hypothetical protein
MIGQVACAAGDAAGESDKGIFVADSSGKELSVMAHKVKKSTGSTREDEVRHAVREHYKELALKEVPCCGSGKSTMCGCGLYAESDVA